MKRVTPKTIQERKNSRANFADLPKLRDIVVDLSVKNTPKVVRKLRFDGPPVEIAEIQDKVATWSNDDSGKRVRETKKVPFPDADKNGSPTRIGHDNADECPWRKMGYVVTRRFVQRCLEEQEDGSWSHKILVKGPAIFDEAWGAVSSDEKLDHVAKFLQKYVKVSNRQIIFATHQVNVFGEYADHIIRVTQKDGISTVN
jgi:hypothetical protein